MRTKRQLLLKLVVHLYLRWRFAHSKFSRIYGPPEIKRCTKRFVPPRQRSVNNVFAITAHCDKSPVRAVHQALRIQVAAAQVLHREREALAILDIVVRRKGLDIHRLHVVMLGPDDLPTLIHAGDRILAANFEHHGALIIPNRHRVGTLADADRPHALQPVVQRIFESICRAVPYPESAVL